MKEFQKQFWITWALGAGVGIAIGLFICGMILKGHGL